MSATSVTDPQTGITAPVLIRVAVNRGIAPLAVLIGDAEIQPEWSPSDVREVCQLDAARLFWSLYVALPRETYAHLTALMTDSTTFGEGDGDGEAGARAMTKGGFAAQ